MYGNQIHGQLKILLSVDRIYQQNYSNPAVGSRRSNCGKVLHTEVDQEQ